MPNSASFIQYHLSCQNPASQYLSVQLLIPVSDLRHVELKLPIWRPGRYFPSNYAQFIRNFSVKNPKGQSVPFKKSSKACWEFEQEMKGTYQVSYEFYAATLDAGSAWIDEKLVYLNLVNCCMDVWGLESLSYQFHFQFPFPVQVCTLPSSPSGSYQTSSFQTVADTTVLATQELTHWEFKVADTAFHSWIVGTIDFSRDVFLDALKTTAEQMIADFGEFPEKEFHVMLLLVSYPHYHGVEHQRGTVITFGPAEKLRENEEMNALLGICSHELYHAWNVCRIRPKDYLPYDFFQESPSYSGWIMEGITSYMGDVYLLRGEVYSLETYLQKLTRTIQRVSENFGYRHTSLLDSSFDTWVDGYHVSAPDRKQNIYANGALVALALDLLLLKAGCSLPELMRDAWIQFGKPFRGYDESSFWELFRKFKGNWNNFYESYIAGNESIIPLLGNLLEELGIALTETTGSDRYRHQFGLLCRNAKVEKVHPDSPAYHQVMCGDQIKEMTEGGKILLQKLDGSQLHMQLPLEQKVYFPIYELHIGTITALREKWLAKKKYTSED